MNIDLHGIIDLGGGDPLKPKVGSRRHTAAMRERRNQRTRRIESEDVLYSMVDWHLEEGDVWHIISDGDIDALSFIRKFLKESKTDYLLCSTWRIAMTDVLELEELVQCGAIGRLDIYLGKNPSIDPGVRERLESMEKGGGVWVFPTPT